MDWIRRNWPDLLIGVALVAVIAGIIVTLLGGGSVFDFARSPGAPASPEPGTAVTTPQTADEPESPLAATRMGDGEAPGEEAPGEEVPGEDQAGTPSADVVIPVPPSAGADPAPEGPVATPLDPEAVATDNDTATDGETALADPPQQPATTVPTPAPPSAALTTTTPTGAEQTGAPLTDEETAVVDVGAPWRILVGTFRVSDNAERLAAEMRAEDHPVFIATQEDLNMVLVGPFDDEAQTRDLAQQFRDAGREAEVYRVSGGAETASTVASTAAAPVTEPVSTLEATDTIAQPETTQLETTEPEATQLEATTPTTDAQAPAAGGSRYMQVGAYRTTESAAPQRELLESMGYEVTPLTTDSGLIRLLIGPFSPEEAESVRSRLDAQGVEHTPGPATLN